MLAIATPTFVSVTSVPVLLMHWFWQTIEMFVKETAFPGPLPGSENSGPALGLAPAFAIIFTEGVRMNCVLYPLLPMPMKESPEHEVNVAAVLPEPP